MSDSRRIITPTDGLVSRMDTGKPQIGIVKSNNDSENMGRLTVWIKGSGSLEDDPAGWITCSYASPFAGATDPQFLGNDTQSYHDTQDSYGFWAIPPDINNLVIVQFINGDIKQAFWTGCIYQKNMNHMVPGIAAGASFQDGSGSAPVAEYNKLGTSNSVRPVYPPLASGLKKQGLLGDDLRGAGNSSARRESPSNVFGIKTPGGNQLILDDGIDNQLIRFRTASGVQILLSETVGNIYMITKDGKSWIELGNDGNVDVYAEGSLSYHAKGDINFKSGSNVLIESENDINIVAGHSLNLESKIKGIGLSAKTNIDLLAQQNIGIDAQGNLNVRVGQSFNRAVSGTSSVRTTGLDITTYANDRQIWQASGKKVIQDSFPHPTEVQNTMPVTPTAPVSPEKIKTFQQTVKNEAGQEAPITSICARVPDAEPWANHAQPVAGYRNQIQEESQTLAKRGSVSSSAVSPLPVVGSPGQGMAPGVYTPNGYDKNQEPIYDYSGPTTALTSVNDLSLSNEGLAFISRHEGFRSSVYLDAAGLPTIGYGHLIVATDPPNVKKGPLDTTAALALLNQDVKKAEDAVRKYVRVPLTQSQYDALVSFTFNCGPGALQKSTLLKQLNSNSYADVPNQLMRWNKAGGQAIAGLTTRRREEALLFSRPSTVA